MLETLLLVLSVSIDSFLASMAYGTNKIKIPIISALIIDFICSLMLAVSIFFGSYVKDYLPANVAVAISFSILLLLGFYRLFESVFKNIINKKCQMQKPVTFNLFDFHFILQVYADETKADLDKSKILSAKEALYLALALSLDSLAVGFGSSLITINLLQVIIVSLCVGFVFIILGCKIGRKFIEKVDIDLSWLSGALLIFLAFIRTFG